MTNAVPKSDAGRPPFGLIQLPPLSLYIHIPWCIRKCPYCDFNSHAVAGSPALNSHEQPLIARSNADKAGHNEVSSLQEAEYIQCLLEDLETELEPGLNYAQGRSLSSIFIGGGTPSLFSAEGIDRLLRQIERRIAFAEDIEITLEANPGTFEQEKFRGYRQAGVNRLSIGIQSFNDRHLKRLGRIHGGTEARQAVDCAVAAGFNNFNLDLMHGLPQQSAEEALQDLATACDFGPSHLSWYQLTIEPNTEFYKRPPVLPDDDALWQIQQRGMELLSQRGFTQYEVSAYCRAEQAGETTHASRHNRNYWQFGDYLGIGAGAHGKISLLQEQRIIRTRKTRLPKDYLNAGGNFTAATEVLEPEALPGEFILNALRLNQGFSRELFEQRTGLPLHLISKPIETARAQGLMDVEEPFRASPQGQLFLNNLIELFI